MFMKHNKLVVILGPTASGKTDIALKLAKKFSAEGGSASGGNGVEIISADSRAIYKEMDIGTAKAVPKIRNPKSEIRNGYIINGIPHYIINIVRPDQEFTVAQFKQKAIKIIKNIQGRKKIPFLVGGTGLYISAIVDNLKIPQVLPDSKLRQKLERLVKNRGLNFLWQKLIGLDPAAQKFVDKNNPRRVIRALEVCLKTKKPFSELRKMGKPLFNVLQIGVKLPRRTLYKKINTRVDKMIEMGLVDEVKKLIKKYPVNLPAFSGIGYKEIISYLYPVKSRKAGISPRAKLFNRVKGEISLPEAVDLIKKNTRHYAKRQITWFKRDKRIKWIKDVKTAEKLIKNFLKESEPVL